MSDSICNGIMIWDDVGLTSQQQTDAGVAITNNLMGIEIGENCTLNMNCVGYLHINGDCHHFFDRDHIMYLYICTYIYIYIMYTCLYVYMLICICVYIYR